MMTRLGGTALLLALAAAPAAAQDPARMPLPPQISLQLAPTSIQYTVGAADSILASGGPEDVSLEAFDGAIATGIYLYGTFGGALESVGYGHDQSDRRYMWLSVSRGDSLEYMAMLYDVDRDLAPDYLLFRTIDYTRQAEFVTEYRNPTTRDTPFDISIQSACRPPRCDPARWTVHDRNRVDVTAFWFEMWRPVVGLAAMRGERWLGRPIAALPPAQRRSGT